MQKKSNTFGEYRKRYYLCSPFALNFERQVIGFRFYHLRKSSLKDLHDYKIVVQGKLIEN